MKTIVNELTYRNVFGIGWRLTFVQRKELLKRLLQYFDDNNIEYCDCEGLADYIWKLDLGFLLVGNSKEQFLIKKLPTWCQAEFFHNILIKNMDMIKNNSFLQSCQNILGEPVIINTRLAIEECELI